MTNNTTDNLRISTFDIITPVYNPDYRLGNTCLKDKRQFNPLKSYFADKINYEAKALLVYNQSTGNVLYSKNITQVIDVTTGVVEVIFTKGFKTVPIMSGCSYASNILGYSFNFDIDTFQRPNTARILCYSDAGALNDSQIYVAFFGELIDESEEIR